MSKYVQLRCDICNYLGESTKIWGKFTDQRSQQYDVCDACVRRLFDPLYRFISGVKTGG